MRTTVIVISEFDRVDGAHQHAGIVGITFPDATSREKFIPKGRKPLDVAAEILGEPEPDFAGQSPPDQPTGNHPQSNPTSPPADPDAIASAIIERVLAATKSQEDATVARALRAVSKCVTESVLITNDSNDVVATGPLAARLNECVAKLEGKTKPTVIGGD